MHLLKLFPFLLLIIILTKNAKSNEEEQSRIPKNRLKILVHTWTSTYSHYKFQSSVADALAEAGHIVHVLQMDSVSPWNGTIFAKKVAKIIHIPIEEAQISDFTKLKLINNPFTNDKPKTIVGLRSAMSETHSFFADMCRSILSRKNMIEELKKERYDVALAEPFDECLAGIFALIGVRTRCCATLATQLIDWVSMRFDIPVVRSFSLDINSISAPSNFPTIRFYDRALAVFNTVFMRLLFAGVTEKLERALFEEYFPEAKLPSLSELLRNSSLLFVNSNEFFDLPRLISSKIVFIGGIAMDEMKTSEIQNKAVKQIFERESNGVVLISFGSLTNTSIIPRTMVQAMVTAFKRFPDFEFIWKFARNESDPWENELFAGAKNVHPQTWVEQKAILANPRTRGFISHCGQNSANEAATAGVPVVAVPLFGDQIVNAINLRHKDVAVVIDVQTLIKSDDASDTLTDALEKILNDPDYRKRAQILRQKIVSTPFLPKERLVRWVEFAAQFDQLPELNLPSERELGFLQYHSLDVIGFIFLAVLIIIWLAFRVLNFFAKIIIRAGRKSNGRDFSTNKIKLS